MSSYRVAIIPGDGVGNEVAAEAVKILRVSADKHGFKTATEIFDWGCDYYLRNGIMMPENALTVLRQFDAIFLGCIGDAGKVPDHISLTMLLAIRKGFDQYINLRPIKLYPGVETPLKTATPETVDMVVVRENTEGREAFSSREHRMPLPFRPLFLPKKGVREQFAMPSSLPENGRSSATERLWGW
jgi:tartrate dehydrogenase/decarboxylase/D-malate dehydrogenase